MNGDYGVRFTKFNNKGSNPSLSAESQPPKGWLFLFFKKVTSDCLQANRPKKIRRECSVNISILECLIRSFLVKIPPMNRHEIFLFN
ncbi:MAG: hypothetical protein C0433_14460 [Cyclobacterium sp.]|nr:hypothetical protein [Cyclobacterium sp.]